MGLWLHLRLLEIEYRLIKPELDIFQTFKSWVGNQYEYFEIVFLAWKSAYKVSAATQ